MRLWATRLLLEANKPYTLTIVPVAGYDNIVTATMGGERIELTVSENSYTTPNVTGNLVFTIDKVCNTMVWKSENT